MKFISMIILCCSLLFACHKDVLTNEFPKEETSLEIFPSADSSFGMTAKERIKTSSCPYQLFGFADFPFQSNVINGIDYPFCTNQLCILIESADANPYFSISSETLKICETGFESMSHHANCADFSPTQITYLNYVGGTELHFFFADDFWDCFFDTENYPGMDFRLEHGEPFI